MAGDEMRCVSMFAADPVLTREWMSSLARTGQAPANGPLVPAVGMGMKIALAGVVKQIVWGFAVRAVRAVRNPMTARVWELALASFNRTMERQVGREWYFG